MIFELGNSNTLIEIWRDEKLKRHKKIYKNQPYFYIPTEEAPRAAGMNGVVKVEYGHQSLFGDECAKLFVEHPSVVPKIRDFFSKTFEADIPYIRRCVIDCVDKVKNEHYVTMYFDIESTVKSDLLDPDNEILSISAYDTLTNEYHMFCWHPNGSQEFSTEKEMLKGFQEYFREIKPEVLTAWNIAYDLQMVDFRLGNRHLSEFNQGSEREIRGVICADLSEIYRRLARKTNSWRLAVVSEVELDGVTKIDTNGMMPEELHKAEMLDELKEYNEQDVRLLKMLDEKLGMIRYMLDIQAIAGITFGDVYGNSLIIDALCIRYAREMGVVLPSKTSKEYKHVKGGLVLEPEVGLHDDVTVFDAKAEYPSIILTCNISPECLDPEGDIKLANGVTFSSKKPGLLPTLLRDLLDLRQRYKDEGATSKQLATKIVANAVYGVCLFPSFRLFNPDCGRSITYMGRIVVQEMSDYFESVGAICIYGDTDSVFVKELPNDPATDLANLNEYLRVTMKKIAGDRDIEILIELDKEFSKLALSGKKHYCGYLTNGDFVVKGLEMAKTNAAEVSRRSQRELVDIMFNEGDIDAYLLQLRNGFKQLPLSDLAVPQRVHSDKNVPHVRARNLAIKAGLIWEPMRPIEMLYTKGLIDCVPLRDDFDISGFEVDYDRMWDITIDNKLSPFLSMLGMKCIPLKKTLSDFMKVKK